MNVDFSVYYTYTNDLQFYVRKAFTKCMEEMKGVNTVYFDINTADGSQLAQCLDSEPIYGVQEGGKKKEECMYKVMFSPMQIYLVDNKVKTNCHDYYGNYKRQAPKVIAKAGIESIAYGENYKFQKHKFSIKYLCADSFNNYAGAGTRLFKVIVDSLLDRDCFGDDINEDDEDPVASLFSANNSFYDGNPDLFEKSHRKYSNSTYDLKPEGFQKGTKAGDRNIRYHEWEDDDLDNNAKEALEGEEDIFNFSTKETWKMRDRRRPFKPPIYERKTPKREREYETEEEEEDDEEEDVDPNEIQSIHTVPPGHRVVGRVYRHADDGNVVWDGEDYMPQAMWDQKYPEETEGTGYAKLVRGAGYAIRKHTREQAKKLGVTVKPSTEKNKKIDVHKGGKKIASVGHKDYTDYATLLKTAGKEEADRRRKAYKSRHEKTRHKVGSNSYYADKLLW